ncbi:MAG TPA: sugar transferase [Jatrophihabitans sp.]|nr:sugar transferase [Jatrophihabitans sp.]
MVAAVGAHAQSAGGLAEPQAITTPAGRQLRPVGRSLAVSPPPPVDRGRRSVWLLRYRRGLVGLDFLIAAAATFGAYLLRFDGSWDRRLNLFTVLLLPLCWITVIALNHGYDDRFVGVGATEFQRIFHAFLHVTALVAFASFISHADLSRGFVLVALPVTLLVNLLARYAARKWLHRQRAAGRALKSVLLVGDAEAIVSFTKVLRDDRYVGMRVVGACVPSEVVAETSTVETLVALNVPLLGDVDSVLSAVRQSGADTVAVVSSGRVGPEKLRSISWQLEGSETDLVVSPGLIEVAGPRLHILPVAGLPLLHVEEPTFSGFSRVVKGAFDRGAAALMLFCLSPVFLAIVLAVRISSRGPALFKQTRVGRSGTEFTMLKFRSMYVDAEDRLLELERLSDGNGMLFKMRSDPRVTRVGQFLRKYSLDELPQLMNVLRGHMSLVGPRPPLPREVARYETHVHRRLLVKPGLTGLWQISGRSDLSWEETVRLDLRYVENWSIATDLLILWKTARAVVAGSGAY